MLIKFLEAIGPGPIFWTQKNRKVKPDGWIVLLI